MLVVNSTNSKVIHIQGSIRSPSQPDTYPLAKHWAAVTVFNLSLATLECLSFVRDSVTRTRIVHQAENCAGEIKLSCTNDEFKMLYIFKLIEISKQYLAELPPRFYQVVEIKVNLVLNNRELDIVFHKSVHGFSLV